MALRRQTILLVLYTLIVLIGILWAAVSWGGDKIIQSTGDVSTKVGGTDAWGFGSTGVDIDDCVSSYSVLFGLWQDVRLNPSCIADKLDELGRHKEAAEMRCSIRRVRRVYGSDCVARLIYAAPQQEEPKEVSELVNKIIIRQDAVTEPIKAEVAQLRKDLESQESARIAAERRSQRAYEARQAEQQAIIQKTLDQLPKDGK